MSVVCQKPVTRDGAPAFSFPGNCMNSPGAGAPPGEFNLLFLVFLDFVNNMLELDACLGEHGDGVG